MPIKMIQFQQWIYLKQETAFHCSTELDATREKKTRHSSEDCWTKKHWILQRINEEIVEPKKMGQKFSKSNSFRRCKFLIK